VKVEVRNVTKRYKRKTALHNISLQIDEPKIYALLGRNGAGKTTLMELIAGHILPTEGEIIINGVDPFDERSILKEICLIKENDNFHKDLKVKDVLQTYANFYEKWNDTLATQLIESYNLPLNARVKALSKGMESALGVIVGLASGAKLTIFDEPYIGMDAIGRQQFYNQLVEVFEAEERTILFSTHLIDEASLLFQEIFIINNGELILEEDAETIRVKAYAVMGQKKEVEAYIKGKKVLRTKQLSNMLVAYLYDDKGDLPDTLQVDGVPIQEVMIYLTEMEGVS